MKQKTVKIPPVVKKREHTPEGANVPTQITVYKCLCGLGRIEHHRVPGFGDDWFEFKCLLCKMRYRPIIDRSGSEWIVYPR